MKKFFCLVIVSCYRLAGQDQFNNTGIMQTFPEANLAFYGNFSNSGTLTDNGSSVSFPGLSTQLISGTSVTTFSNISIMNAAGVKLAQDVVVVNSLNLISGQLDLASNSLTVNNGQIGAISRVNGYVLSEKYDNSAKLKWSIGTTQGLHVFPFGTVSGEYVPFSFDLTNGDVGNVTVSTYSTGVNNVPYPVSPDSVTNMFDLMNLDNSINVVDRFWQIEKDGISGTADISFAFTPSEAGNLTGFNAQRWNSGSKHWEVPLSGQLSGSYLSAIRGVSSFSTWAISGSDSFLPIELINFGASKSDKVVSIDWATESEINSDFFTVEKTKDGVTYEEVDHVRAAGRSTSLLNYHTTDSEPYNGTSYYRLKQTDFSGEIIYSKLVAIEFYVPNGDFIVYPNPVKENNLNILLPSDINNNVVLVTIEDELGRECYSTEIAGIAKEKSLVKLNFPKKFNPGVYLVIVSCGESVYSKRIIIEE